MCVISISNFLKSFHKPLDPQSESLENLVQDSGELKGKSIDKQEVPTKTIVNLNTLSSQGRREYMFHTMTIHKNVYDENGRLIIQDILGKIGNIVDRIFAHKRQYEHVSHTFPNPIRWYHVALIHLMEGELNFNTYLGNGQSLYRKTTIVPKGRGPFKNFYEGAVDAIRYKNLDKIQDWSIGSTLEMFERWNGWGYVLYHPTVNSPYLWSCTNYYTKGKYVSDGRFRKNAVSSQIGIAPIYKEILGRLK